MIARLQAAKSRVLSALRTYATTYSDMKQMILVHKLSSIFSKIHFSVILLCTHRSSKPPFPIRTSYAFLLVPIPATCRAQIILLESLESFISIIFCEASKFFLQLFYPFSCYDLCLASRYASQNAVLEHLTTCSSLTAMDQVSCPNGIDRIMVLHILMFMFLDRIRKDLSPNCSELSSDLLCH